MSVRLITAIATKSSRIADLTRFITSHPMAPSTPKAYEERAELLIEREELRKEMDDCPDVMLS